MSLAETALSGAILIVHIGETSEVRNSTKQARAGRWDFETSITAEGLPPYVDSADATAAAMRQNWRMQGAAVRRARAAVDGGAGEEIGGRERSGYWKWRVTSARCAAREPSVAERVETVGGGDVGPVEHGGESRGAGEGSRRRSGQWREHLPTAAGVKRDSAARLAAYPGGRGVAGRPGDG